MMRQLFIPAVLAVCVSASIPFDLPREIFMDVNKGQQNVINIIADRAGFLRAPAGAGVDQALKKMHPSESMAMIKSTISDALVAASASEGVPVDAVLCSRNYSVCPSGWASLGDLCLAPINYAGSCGQTLSFGGMTPTEMAGQAGACDASFPCM